MDEQRAHSVDSDAEQLRALGYTSHFDRTMSKCENFSLGFTYLSPVVGVYTVFAANFVIGDAHLLAARQRPALDSAAL